MEKGIREYPVERTGPAQIITHPRAIREKVVHDIDMYIRQREYGKASELLLVVVENGSMALDEIWWLLLASVRVQGPPNSLGHYLDSIVFELKNRKPYTTAMERVFTEMESGRMEVAYSILVALTQEQGSKLSFAHGYLGILIACMREVEIRRLNKAKDIGIRPAEPHVFGLCKPNDSFSISADDGKQFSKYTLRDAERHLSHAVFLDPETEFFRGFYAQVLVALGKTQAAKELAEQWYKGSKTIPNILILLSLCSSNLLAQENLVLEYLEMDPFAPAVEMFCKFMDQVFVQIQDAHTVDRERILNMLVDRIERGNANESYVWKYLAQFVACLREQEHHNVVDHVFALRLPWWKDTYFSTHVFCLSELSDALVYRAVCARLLLVDLPLEHPSATILNSKLTDEQIAFVKTHFQNL
ncbi:hypothetical protein IW140_002953 [Coemansia sp. RSA 1813]|nr:hypothetical protein EV178_002873 [Coemansia sp. RSA 1646]KAJ1771943.1 hypothetical protein LPJ74_001835 [Coemansia sp. RSA 1843]KAJ2089714.1 hypothetical protein IW138_003170 [Coemansia sp. RSA 986]KAJ2214282.1 hypothetical protein EV179_003184 [Coemansia sp. RSA 487]KAJ2569699.1 hypothetical protein IW140_002953 [Coemansia sp. RSA 1813]